MPRFYGRWRDIAKVLSPSNPLTAIATLVYVAKFPALSGPTQNWLLENAPNAYLYLYGACLDADCLDDVRDASQMAKALFDEAMDGLLGLTRQYRFSEPPIRSLDASLTGRAFERAF